jgi:site-specific recombinase XerD
MPISTFNVLKEYLQIRPVLDGPLFCHLNRTSLTRKQFVHVLHASLKFMGYTTDKLYTHSYRISAATYLSKLGYSNEEIQKGVGGCQTLMNGIFDFNSVLIFF